MVNHRRQRVTDPLRQNHQPHGAQIPHSQRPRRLILPCGDGAQAAADVFREVGRLAQSQRDQREQKLRIHLVNPHLQRLGQQRRNREVPHHQLNKRRYVAVVGDIRRHQQLREALVAQADHHQHQRNKHGQQPCTQRQFQSDDGAINNHLAVVASHHVTEVECHIPSSFAVIQDSRSPGRIVDSPPGTCSVGVISILPMLTATGAASAKATQSAMSFASGSSKPSIKRRRASS